MCRCSLTCRSSLPGPAAGPVGFWCWVLVVVVLWPVAADAQTWVVTDIGATAGVMTSRAYAVSDTGQVVGSYTTAGGQPHAFSWTRSGEFVDLGTLGGTHSEAHGVNNAGQVVGWSYIAGNTASHAFLWSPSTGMLDLGTLGGPFSQAYDINNAGQIVGSAVLIPRP